jgi:hypothetical protein
MKKALYFFIYIILALPLGAESIELYAFTDAMAVKSFLPSQIYGSVGFGASLHEDIAIEIPVSFLFDQTGGKEAYVDTSIRLLIYPWSKGPYISLSLIRLISFVGDFLPQENFHYLNDISIGYRWNFFSLFSISPCVTIRDPSELYKENYEYIRGFVPSFGKIDFSLNVQFTITHISID